jgi:hypothetical protein
MIGFNANAPIFGIESNATLVGSKAAQIEAQAEPAIPGVVVANRILTRGTFSKIARAVWKEAQLG